MHIKLDYICFSDFDFKVKVTEILEYILLFSGSGQGLNYQVFGKY